MLFPYTTGKREIVLKFNHKTVLLHETLDLLNINSNGVYVDATAGGGGLSEEIAVRLSNTGRLVCIDQDPDAVVTCSERLKKFNNVSIVKDNFANIENVVHKLGFSGVDGVVLDLGVSSYQLDSAERGFSYNKEAILDMRMSQVGESAYDVVNYFSFEKLRDIIWKYGEDKFSSKIARSIIKFREKEPIKYTTQLSDIVKNSIPAYARREGGHPAKRTFQAIRIYVNDELGVLSCGLDGALNVLNIGGRVVAITFHSLEDKIVKKKMKDWCTGCVCPADFPICVCGKSPRAVMVHKKVIKPTLLEVESNYRSRSAKLRVCEKINKS